MADTPARPASSTSAWIVIGVAIAWAAIWNGLDTAFPAASLDANAGPVLGFIFGLVAGAAAYWRRSRGKSVRPVIVGIGLWFLAFGIFVVAGATGQ